MNPGLILTPDWVKTAKQLSADDWDGDWEAYLQSVADEHAPIKRFGTVEELADFMVFLCSPARLLRGRRHLLRRRRHAPHHLRRLDDGQPPLSLATLDRLPAGVARPTYARGDLSPGILHFGVGNFHRAHLQVYLDRLMNAGARPRLGDRRRRRHALRRQDARRARRAGLALDRRRAVGRQVSARASPG